MAFQDEEILVAVDEMVGSSPEVGETVDKIVEADETVDKIVEVGDMVDKIVDRTAAVEQTVDSMVDGIEVAVEMGLIFEELGCCRLRPGDFQHPPTTPFNVPPRPPTTPFTAHPQDHLLHRPMHVQDHLLSHLDLNRQS